jgi:hypothetical protein
LAVNGKPLRQKPAASIRVPKSRDTSASRVHASALEQIGETVYQVLLAVDPKAPTDWRGLDLPGDVGPVEMEAEGYLVVADHREDGACCDSRALGWIQEDQVRGELVMRLGRRAHEPAEGAEGSGERVGVRWLP